MRIVHAGIIVIVGLWVFSPAFSGEWLFDDIQGILANTSIHTPAGLWRIWFPQAAIEYFPLTESVRCLQWLLWGKNTFGYHLANALLHVASALLIWRLFSELGMRGAWLGGLIFAVHPLVVESVAWISELKNTLSLLFLLMAMLAYIQYDTRGGRTHYLRSVVAFIAALLSKSSVVMFPVVILLYGWWRHGRVRREDWRRSAIFFVLSLVFGVVAVLFQRHVLMDIHPSESPGFLLRLLRAGLIIVFYLSKFFWPVDLDIVYPRWDVQAAWMWEVFSWFMLILLLGWLASRNRAWARHALFGLLFFLVNLVPVLGFTKMIWMNYSWVSDHLVYLPMIGLVGLVAAAVGDVRDRHVSGRPLLGVVAACVVAVLVWQSHSYARLFRTSVGLWTYNLERNSESWLGYNNLAVALAGAGKPEAAIREIQLGLKVRPNQALSYLNLSNAWQQLGRMPEAIEAGQTAVSLEPGNGLLRNQMGNVFVRDSQFDKAIEQYRIALQLDPNDVEAHSNLAGVFIQTERTADAIEEGKIAVRIDPTYPPAYDNLGIALGQAGQFPEAATQFEVAASLAPDDAEIQHNWGVALVRQGDFSEAALHFQRAAQLDPAYGPSGKSK